MIPPLFLFFPRDMNGGRPWPAPAPAAPPRPPKSPCRASSFLTDSDSRAMVKSEYGGTGSGRFGRTVGLSSSEDGFNTEVVSPLSFTKTVLVSIVPRPLLSNCTVIMFPSGMIFLNTTPSRSPVLPFVKEDGNADIAPAIRFRKALPSCLMAAAVIGS